MHHEMAFTDVVASTLRGAGISMAADDEGDLIPELAPGVSAGSVGLALLALGTGPWKSTCE